VSSGEWWETVGRQGTAVAAVVGAAVAVWKLFARWLRGLVRSEIETLGMAQVKSDAKTLRADFDRQAEHSASQFDRLGDVLTRIETGLDTVEGTTRDLRTDMGWVKRFLNGGGPG
jgi:hypothetical protein